MTKNELFERAFLHFKAVQITTLDKNGGILKTASGFIRRESGELFLYTCWHIVSGSIDRSDRKIPSPWARPAALRLRLQDVTVRTANVHVVGGLQEIEVPLYDVNRVPLWAQNEAEVPDRDLNHAGFRVPFWHDAIKMSVPRLRVSDMQVLEESSNFPEILVPGDKLLIVGYPFGYSALGKEQPTPIVITRFIAAMGGAEWQQELLLDSAGAGGMSGGPVFLERDSHLHLIGLYTGVVRPNPQERGLSLGRCCNMKLTWSKPGLPLVFFHSPAVAAEAF